MAIVSLGCAKNLVDSEVMAGLLREAGFALHPDPEAADVVIVNTCGFIEPAQRESVDAILRIARSRARARPGGARSGLVVAGCLPRRFDAVQVASQLPEADAVIGNAEVPLIAEVVREVLEGHRVVMADDAPSFLYHDRIPRLLSTPGHLAYVKVSEGCDHPCTFCTIPRIRGQHRSRPLDSIEREVAALAERGVQEVVLVGQDTTLYGVDLYGRLMLPDLLRRLARTGIAWIRLLYAYPAHVTGELIATMAELPQVCRYLDLPLQHASDRVLRAMRRWGNRQAYEALIDRVRRAMPDVALRTTFIVGFPGETDRDVEELLEFVERAGFDHVGVFTYAREEGTPAASLPGQVPAVEKRRRRAAVMRRQQELLPRIMGRRLGAGVPVLLERPARRSRAGATRWQGRTPYQAPEVDGVTWLKVARARPGEMVSARLAGMRGYDFEAELATSLEAAATS
ncbi:MAG: 30S ribosomal protein S12 methylthiotransferase RimO [Limnochordaceae bacterium]|nr:30S ribosomal protein S12 methylthiotransferase RimO [Limnochordaceae bacterium]